MATANKVKAMVSGDIIICIPVHVAVLIMQISIYNPQIFLQLL